MKRLDFGTMEYIVERLCPSQQAFKTLEIEMPESQADMIINGYRAPNYDDQFRDAIEETSDAWDTLDKEDFSVVQVPTERSLLHAVLYCMTEDYRELGTYDQRCSMVNKFSTEFKCSRVDPKEVAKTLEMNVLVLCVKNHEFYSASDNVDKTLPTLLLYRTYMDVYLPITYKGEILHKENPLTIHLLGSIQQKEIVHPTPSSKKASTAPNDIRRRELNKYKLSRLQDLCDSCGLCITKPGKGEKPIKKTRAELIESLISADQ